MYVDYALQCKSCGKNEAACLLGHGIVSEKCPSDDDLCYSWFDRTSKLRKKNTNLHSIFIIFAYKIILVADISVQRGCISSKSHEYKTIKKFLSNLDEDCVKRVDGLDCFKICAEDNCN